MLIIGLTGSIGMGKSKAAAHFRELGIGVFDADAEVHRIYESSAVPLIEAAFPGTVVGARVDRARLSAALAKDASGFKTLEAIVHPLVRAAERAFLIAEQAKGAHFAVLEIPLLFETRGDERVDAVVVVSTDDATQRARVLQRPGMSDAKLDTILARQLSDTEKRAKADFVVDTSGPVTDTYGQIDHILTLLKERPATAFQRIWTRDEA
jgi:dephospho-CoA kinase